MAVCVYRRPWIRAVNTGRVEKTLSCNVFCGATKTAWLDHCLAVVKVKGSGAHSPLLRFELPLLQHKPPVVNEKCITYVKSVLLCSKCVKLPPLDASVSWVPCLTWDFNYCGLEANPVPYTYAEPHIGNTAAKPCAVQQPIKRQRTKCWPAHIFFISLL